MYCSTLINYPSFHHVHTLIHVYHLSLYLPPYLSLIVFFHHKLLLLHLVTNIRLHICHVECCLCVCHLSQH